MRPHRLTALMLTLSLLGPGADSHRAAARAEPQDPPRLPKGVTEVTKEHLLTKVPNFFYFDYPHYPSPGKRWWLRVDYRHFIERYPDGRESRYKILGRATVRDESGTVVAKIGGDPKKTVTPNDGTFKVFIPDKGNKSMVILIRHGSDPDWRDMRAADKKSKIVIEKVE
jgi:hypothetical protein